ncbi:MAG TPA: L,D-transpeptidase family protein [Solirubrobacteraceae bacterium]
MAGLLVILVAAVLIYDHSRRDMIAKGVTVDGIAVGGLSESAARTKLERDLVARLNEPVVVRSGSRSWTLAHGADVRVDLPNMLGQAVRASREGSIVTRTFRSLFGGSVHRDIALVATYSHRAVTTLTAQVRSQVNRAPQDATVQPAPSGLRRVPSRAGVTVVSDILGGRMKAALLAPLGSRTVTVPTRTVQPKVTTAQLASRYPAYIVINRGAFRLQFYSHLKLARTYEIAVGMEGLETPAGLHKIEWEQVNPPWYVPKKAWAGSLAGTVVPPGPGDPLKARFMSFEGGAGIHGIDPSEYSTIGHDASHGCVRMRIPDVIELYSKSPVGTPVYII